MPKGTIAFTFFPFIFVRDEVIKNNVATINHESIHGRQQVEMLLIFFFLWYYIEYLINYFIYKSWDKAYYQISFERESYKNEKNPDYLKTRKLFSWVNYIK